jgi:hypothetical protein
MLLRKVTSAGVAGSFIVVAATVTAVLLLGWRAIAQFGRRPGYLVVTVDRDEPGRPEGRA